MARCFPFPPKGYVKADVLAERARLQEVFEMNEERSMTEEISMKQERKEKKRKVRDSDINYNGNLEEKETKTHEKKNKHSEKSKSKQCDHDETSKSRSGRNDVSSGESKSKNGGFDDDSASGKSKSKHSGFGGSDERSSARMKYNYSSKSDVAEDMVRFTESRSEKSNSKYERSKEKSDKIGEAVSECANAKFKFKVSQKDTSKDSVITRADSSDKSENTPMLLSNVLSERSKANAHKYAINGTLTQANQEQQKQIKNGTVEKGMALWSNLPVLTDKDRQNKRLLQTLNEELPKGSAKRSSGSPATSMRIMKSQDCTLQIVGSKKKVNKSCLHDSGNAYNDSLKSQHTYSASSKSRDSQVGSETKESRKMSEIHPVNQSACDQSGTKATEGTSLPSSVSLSKCNQNIKQSNVQSGTNASKGMPLPSPLSFRFGKRNMASADIEHDKAGSETKESRKMSKIHPVNQSACDQSGTKATEGTSLPSSVSLSTGNQNIKRSNVQSGTNASKGMPLPSPPSFHFGKRKMASAELEHDKVGSETKESRKMSEIHPVNQSACDQSGTKATEGTSLPSSVSLSTCNQNIKQSNVQSGTNASKGMPLPSPLSFRFGKRKMASADIEHDTQRSNKISKTQKAESFSYKKIQESERKISENDERMVLSGDHVNQATDATSIPGDQATDAHGCSVSSLRGDHETILTGVSGNQAAEATGVRGDQATSTSGNDATDAFNDSSFLPLPRMQEFIEYDDQSWLLSAKEKTSSTKKVLQSKEASRVWNKAVFLSAVNVHALPFVLPL